MVNGVIALLKSLRLDIRVLASSDAGQPIDTVDTFIQSISVNAFGGNDEGEPGVPCVPLSALMQLADIWSGPKGLSKMQDAVNESALGITPTQKICFNVQPIPNTRSFEAVRRKNPLQPHPHHHQYLLRPFPISK